MAYNIVVYYGGPCVISAFGWLRVSQLLDKQNTGSSAT